MNTRMPVEPSIVDRPEQPYVAIKGFVTMDTFAAIADRLHEVFGWLDARGIAPSGPPFFKYDVIDMERQLEVDAGVPIAAVVEGDGDVFAGRLEVLKTNPADEPDTAKWETELLFRLQD